MHRVIDWLQVEVCFLLLMASRRLLFQQTMGLVDRGSLELHQQILGVQVVIY